ncbi:VPLPA-CTERM sorting domain-containing protein [Ovoidimarina sediminis]|uniref:VPLPA-CTERM sorting domain-containing protein n=1 Tax=Ovoidimarina sediminis TaxID=3079856 RepID=UPI00290E9F0F|nr:VPLPA-CTERM sorting domain-containing protein [Rhodophyticola sp. MJ-SS7]MDU8942321.1 VPLPA-CTERM sorting domain-containing protein [Rhodophyticola sp. MJ-SS7]
MDAGYCGKLPGGGGYEYSVSVQSVAYGEEYYERKCLSDGRTYGTNDFLATVAPVPLPAAGLLMLGALGAMRRRS